MQIGSVDNYGSSASQELLEFTAAATGTYYLRVREYSNYSGDYEIVFSIVVPQPPDTPTGLTVTGTTTNSITLSWTSNGADGYRLYRDDGTGAFSILVYEGPLNTATDSVGLLPNTTYNYAVLAYNNPGGESALSTPIPGTTDSVTTGDSYEDDDDYSLATLLDRDIAQDHTIDPGGDVDWLRISVTVGTPYFVKTKGIDLGGDVDTKLYIYDNPESSELFFNDDDPAGGVVLLY